VLSGQKTLTEGYHDSVSEPAARQSLATISCCAPTTPFISEGAARSIRAVEIRQDTAPLEVESTSLARPVVRREYEAARQLTDDADLM
jgi:hypothetical protein